MLATNINLGCGPVFVESPEWINLDFTASSPAVRQANLLGRLPLESDTAQLVYASHFLEHIPRADVDSFLRKCLRVLRPGGVLRLVLLDLEEMARTYLALRDAGEHERADFLVLEMIDQCVRRESGGELGQFYRRLRAGSAQESEMIAFVRERTGENLGGSHSAAEARGGGSTGRFGWKIRSRCSPSVTAGLGAVLAGRIAGSVPRAERQSRRGRRAPSLALGLPSVVAGTRGGPLPGRGTPHGSHQRDRGFPLLSAGPRHRRATAERRRVDVRGGAQARLRASGLAVTSSGYRHD
jgi:hypothetical protein